MRDVATLRVEDFEPLVGDRFTASIEDVPTIDLELLSAEPHQTGSDDIVAFTVLFRGPDEPGFGQGTVVLEHRELGRLELFLVAVGQDDGGRRYEAVFTRKAK